MTMCISISHMTLCYILTFGRPIRDLLSRMHLCKQGDSGNKSHELGIVENIILAHSFNPHKTGSQLEKVGNQSRSHFQHGPGGQWLCV